MVIAEKYRRFLNVPIYFFWILFLYSSQISAAVIAEVDRERVELNESFTLKIIVDTSIDSASRYFSIHNCGIAKLAPRSNREIFFYRGNIWLRINRSINYYFKRKRLDRKSTRLNSSHT